MSGTVSSRSPMCWPAWRNEGALWRIGADSPAPIHHRQGQTELPPRESRGSLQRPADELLRCEPDRRRWPATRLGRPLGASPRQQHRTDHPRHRRSTRRVNCHVPVPRCLSRSPDGRLGLESCGGLGWWIMSDPRPSEQSTIVGLPRTKTHCLLWCRYEFVNGSAC